MYILLNAILQCCVFIIFICYINCADKSISPDGKIGIGMAILRIFSKDALYDLEKPIF